MMIGLSKLVLSAAITLAAILPEMASAAEVRSIVCVDCHGSLPGRLGEPVKLWRGSVHEMNGIACNSCHGGDPADAANAMSPDRGFLGKPKETAIPAFCGRCHVGVARDYLASAHGNALGEGGPTCVTCHGNHRVVKASLELINEKSCTRCHSFERAQVILESLQGPERMISGIEGRIAAYKQQGTDTDRLEKALFAARNRFRTLFHSVDVDLVKRETGQIVTELKKLEKALQGLDEEHRQRRVFGMWGIGGALVAAGILTLMRRSLD